MDSVVGTELTEEQRIEVSRIWGQTPASALPNTFMGKRPTTVEELINGFASVVAFLQEQMAKEITAQAELDKINSELASFGRLLTRLGFKP